MKGRVRGGPRQMARDSTGQMTVELMAVLPVAIAIAVIVVNALCFMGDCAAFDRVARNAIRTYATSPTYGDQAAQCQARVAAAVAREVDGAFLQTSVSYEAMGAGLVRYTVRASYAPHLFGLGMRESVFGVSLPRLGHTVSLTVDPYKPGLLFE